MYTTLLGENTLRPQKYKYSPSRLVHSPLRGLTVPIYALRGTKGANCTLRIIACRVEDTLSKGCTHCRQFEAHTVLVHRALILFDQRRARNWVWEKRDQWVLVCGAALNDPASSSKERVYLCGPDHAGTVAKQGGIGFKTIPPRQWQGVRLHFPRKKGFDIYKRLMSKREL